jgi:putative DNA primase/helicase
VKHRPGDGPLPGLLRPDLENLRASGLSDVTIRTNGLRTETDHGRLAEIFGRGPQSPVCHAALEIPYTDLEGNPTGFSRFRPHHPPVINGKDAKYLQAKDTTPRAYFPRASLVRLPNETRPILPVEGEKKALALAPCGYCSVGIGGVYAWKKKGVNELIDDLAQIRWVGRVVIIVFDYDPKPKTRLYVGGAMRSFASALRAAGAADVLYVELPPGPDGGKQGVDDYIVAHGEDPFKKLVEGAKPVPTVAKPPALKYLEGRTDVANGSRLAERYSEELAYAAEWDRWVMWDCKRWLEDKGLAAVRKAKAIAADLFREVTRIFRRGDQSVDKHTLGEMLSWAKYSSNAPGIRRMLDMARSELAVSIDQFDTDPTLLNVANGTIDLKTGKIREHNRADYITNLCPVTYDPDAKCPIWDRLLDTCLKGDEEQIGFLQRLAGMSLTGLTVEDVLVFLWGPGGNGKTTFLQTLMKLWGDYAMKAPPDLLMAKRNEAHPTDRAGLFGKRLVCCVETEQGRKLAETLVKELTGGDTISARKLYQDFWEFDPTHKIWLAGNHKPTIVGNDEGIWRRIKLVPFDAVIPEDEQDKFLEQKLTAELPGILNWAVEGCLHWQGHGLEEPEGVRRATQEYRDEQDVIGTFIRQYCEVGEGYTAPATELWLVFQLAMSDDMKQHDFGTRLRQLGYARGKVTTRDRHHGRSGWKGLRLLDTEVVQGFITSVNTEHYC